MFRKLDYFGIHKTMSEVNSEVEVSNREINLLKYLIEMHFDTNNKKFDH